MFEKMRKRCYLRHIIARLEHISALLSNEEEGKMCN